MDMCQPKLYFSIGTHYFGAISVCRQNIILCVMQFIKIVGAYINAHFNFLKFVLLEKLLL